MKSATLTIFWWEVTSDVPSKRGNIWPQFWGSAVIWWGKFSGVNLAMINGGGCKGADGVKTWRGNDGMKGRDDDVVVWEVVISGGEAKACCWYLK